MDWETADVIVIGLGNGGEGIVTHLAEDMSVVAVDAHLAGGECPNYACVPSKMIRHESLRDEPSWPRVAARIRETSNNWDDAPIVAALAETGAQILHGFATREGRRVTVQLAGGGTRGFEAQRAVVVATGSRSVIPEIPGTHGPTPEEELEFPASEQTRVPGESVRLWTHRDVTTATSLPQRIAVVGGGVIACELGQFLARFGVEVTLLVRGDRLLKAESRPVTEFLAERLRAEGVRVLFGSEIAGAEYTESGEIAARVRIGEGAEPPAASGPGETAREETMLVDQILAATGRKPRDEFETDTHLRVLSGPGGDSGPDGDSDLGSAESDDDAAAAPSATPWLFAVGDVSGHGEFTHAAVAEAAVASEVIRAGGSLDEQNAVEPFPAHAVPRATFTIPEVAGIGLSEDAARERAEDEGWDVVSTTKDVSESARGWLDETGGRITVVADRTSGRLLGASLVCEGAGEVLSPLTVAMAQKMTVPQLRRLPWAYPAMHRVIGDVLDELEI